MYKVAVYKEAAKYYKKLDIKTQRRVDSVIESIMTSPSEGSHIKKLKGRLAGKFRYDIGHLRIIYVIDEHRKVIYIEAIGPRGDIYK